jgi:hypothetical protein
MPAAGGEQAQYRIVEDPAHRFAIEQTRMGYEHGILGRIFGSATNAPTSIAGIIVLLFTLTSIAVLFIPANVPASDYLKTVLPIISLSRLWSATSSARVREGGYATKHPDSHRQYL